MNISGNSPSFQGVKYYNYNKDVINSWFNYQMKQDGSSSKKVAKILKEQQDNPHHIILDYSAKEDGEEVLEKATVDGKEFVRAKFESFSHMLTRAAKYANSIKNSSVQPLEDEHRLSDFVLNKQV